MSPNEVPSTVTAPNGGFTGASPQETINKTIKKSHNIFPIKIIKYYKPMVILINNIIIC